MSETLKQNDEQRPIPLGRFRLPLRLKPVGVGKPKTADEKYRELLAFSNNSPDEATRRALSAEVATLAQNVNSTVNGVKEAGDEVRREHRNVEKLESRRARAQLSLDAATERWEQIKNRSRI